MRFQVLAIIIRLESPVNFTPYARNEKEESPYMPETTLLCVRSRSKNVIALIFAPKE